MDIKELKHALRRAAALFSSSGATKQSASIDAVEELISASGDRTVEEFVARTRDALSRAPLGTLSVAEIVERLALAGTDRSKFDQLYRDMQSPKFKKEKALQVAARFTGARATSWPSKPKALEAIRSKFDERVYLASKDAANTRVTPW